MSPPHDRRSRRAAADRGQAAVELVAALPLIAVVVGLGWQAVLAGQAAWAASAAARAAARSAAVGGDAEAVARGRLGAALGRDARVEADGSGRVQVSVRIPRVVRALPLGRVEGEASFRPQEGS